MMHALQRVVVATALVTTGCSSGLTIEDCPGAITAAITVTSTADVDLLLTIDDSNSMSEEQASVAVQIPRMIRALVSGDLDADGRPDHRPVASLHVGVVSSDMGTGASVVTSCPGGIGDDGVLRATDAAGAPCGASHPSVFDFRAGGDLTALGTGVACATQLGTGGCGFEQQLESVLKAVSVAPSSPVSWTAPSYIPPVFVGATDGHGGPGGANDGFLRPNSTLAILLVTDEDDCSTSDTDLFGVDAPAYTGVDLNLRCFSFPRVLFPVARYVDGLIGLRVSAGHLVFGAITGVPTDLGDAPYDAVLADARMQETVDPVSGDRLLPACSAPGRGQGLPARRIVSTAQGLESRGAHTTVSSICTADYSDAFDRFVGSIADTLAGGCLPRALGPTPTGTVFCDVFELLPAGLTCAGLGDPAVTSAGTEEGLELCAVRQLADSEHDQSGWFYDDDPSDPASQLEPTCLQRISFQGHEPVAGATVRLRCCP